MPCKKNKNKRSKEYPYRKTRKGVQIMRNKMMKYCDKHNLPAENYDKIDKKWKCKKCHEEEIKKKVSVKQDRRH